MRCTHASNTGALYSVGVLFLSTAAVRVFSFHLCVCKTVEILIFVWMIIMIIFYINSLAS